MNLQLNNELLSYPSPVSCLHDYPVMVRLLIAWIMRLISPGKTHITHNITSDWVVNIS